MATNHRQVPEPNATQPDQQPPRAEPGSAAGAPPLLERISAGQVARATVAVLALVLAFWMAWRFRFVLFGVVTALFLHIAMKPAVEALHRRGVRRHFGVFIVYIAFFLVAAGLVVVIAPMFVAQVGTFAAQLPDYYRMVRNFMLESDVTLLGRLGRLLPPATDMTQLQDLMTQVTQGAAAPSPWLLLSRLGQGIFSAIAVFSMALYLTLDRDRLLYNLLLRLPAERRDPARDLIAEMESKVGAFIYGQLILCTVVGGLSLIAYFLIGLPYALALGAIAFFAEAIPMIGPVIAAVPAALVAATLGPDKLLWVLLLSVVIQSAENNILVPRIMDRAVGVNAIVTLLAITAFSLLFGILGALLAVPLAAVIQVLLDRYLFSVGSQMMEEEDDAVHAIESSGQRGVSEVLRLEAADLASDVRKQLRSSDTDASPEIAAIEDLIELTATDLYALLAGESAAHAEAAQETPALTPAQAGMQR